MPPHVLRPAQIGTVMEVDYEAVGSELDRRILHLHGKFADVREASPVLHWLLAGVVALALLCFVVLRRATRPPA